MLIAHPYKSSETTETSQQLEVTLFRKSSNNNLDASNFKYPERYICVQRNRFRTNTGRPFTLQLPTPVKTVSSTNQEAAWLGNEESVFAV